MRRVICTLLLAGALTGLAAAPASSARGDTTFKIFRDYTNGGIDPCRYTTAQLEAALHAVTPDIRQYASDYPSAIKDAIAARAGGTCDPSTSGGGAPATTAPPPSASPAAPAVVAPTTATGDPQTTVAEPPGPGVEPAAPTGARAVDLTRAVSAPSGNDAPAPLIGLGLLALLFALTAAMLVALRRLGAGEGRLAPAYHSWREARWRAGGVWDDFRDWLRVGS
ncbi:MAG: hypothetical protein QOI80_427 [Solirubrobacteraceae bacterium]|nr:hypothetical protein [Solirubrobacteraceae bacterium]